MKKIICILLSALLLCANFAMGAFATAQEPPIVNENPYTYTCPVGEDTFTLNSYDIDTLAFEMTDANLVDVTIDYLNKKAFDTSKYDATLYGAYRANLTAEGVKTAFTSNMTVSLAMNETCTNKEIFVFYVTPEITVSEKVPFTREGNTITIKGEDFEKMADRIIVVMTGEEIVVPPVSPLIPALICASVALIAIAITIIVVKRKNAADSIVEQE